MCDKIIVLQLLCLIGESFEHSDDINGAVVNIRPRGDKICKFLSLNQMEQKQ